MKKKRRLLYLFSWNHLTHYFIGMEGRFQGEEGRWSLQ